MGVSNFITVKMKKRVFALCFIALASCSEKKEQVRTLDNVAYIAHVTKFNNGVTWVHVENSNLK